MNSKYELLKDLNSPIGSCKAGVIGKDDGSGRIWFETQYWNKETCDTEPEWFKKLPERIEVAVDGTFDFCGMDKTAYHFYVYNGHRIPKEKYHIIQRAIEKIINDDSVFDADKINAKIEKSEAMEKAFYAAREQKHLDPGHNVLDRIADGRKYPTFESYIKSINP